MVRSNVLVRNATKHGIDVLVELSPRITPYILRSIGTSENKGKEEEGKGERGEGEKERGGHLRERKVEEKRRRTILINAPSPLPSSTNSSWHTTSSSRIIGHRCFSAI